MKTQLRLFLFFIYQIFILYTKLESCFQLEERLGKPAGTNDNKQQQQTPRHCFTFYSSTLTTFITIIVTTIKACQLSGALWWRLRGKKVPLLQTRLVDKARPLTQA